MDELRALHVSLLDYLHQELEDDPIYQWILDETANRGFPEIQITAAQGRLLGLLCKLVNAEQIVEIGSLSGYSTVWLARSMAPSGHIYTLELEPERAEFARQVLGKAGFDTRATVLTGPALENLPKLCLSGPADLVFIDADKPNNRNYFDWAVQHVRPGGLVMVDNVLLNGRVLDPTASSFAQTLYDFNQYVFSQHGARTTVIPFYKAEERNLDGLMIVQVP